jgi:hypothetical protein
MASPSGTAATLSARLSEMSYTGGLVAESLRPGAALAAPMTARRVRRVDAGDPLAGQPVVWTLIEFVVAEEFAEQLIAELGEALEPGPWYCDLASDRETVVVFAERTFRYPRGDHAGRTEAEAHARSVGVPEEQLDWPD